MNTKLRTPATYNVASPWVTLALGLPRGISLRGLAAIAIMGAFSFAGCGQPLAPQPVKVSMESLSSVSGTWRCPALATNNIKPLSGMPYGDGTYRVCQGQDDKASLMVSGTTSSRSICVYPYEEELGTGRLSITDQRQCFAIGSEPIVIRFQNQRLNKLRIVGGEYSQQMDQCQTQAIPCPSYSEGYLLY